MAVGVRVYDSAGNLTLDLGTRVGRFIGTFTTPGDQQSGSFVDSSLVGKTDFFYYYQPASSDYGGPNVTANLSTGEVSWSYDATTSGEETLPPYPSETIYYGAF